MKNLHVLFSCRYLRLKVPEVTGEIIDSSEHRMAAICRHSLPKTRDEVIDILSDRTDKEYSVYQEIKPTDFVKTIATGELFGTRKNTRSLVSIWIISQKFRNFSIFWQFLWMETENNCRYFAKMCQLDDFCAGRYFRLHRKNVVDLHRRSKIQRSSGGLAVAIQRSCGGFNEKFSDWVTWEKADKSK